LLEGLIAVKDVRKVGIRRRLDGSFCHGLVLWYDESQRHEAELVKGDTIDL
jgi:hypothetical protein